MNEIVRQRLEKLLGGLLWDLAALEVHHGNWLHPSCVTVRNRIWEIESELAYNELTLMDVEPWVFHEGDDDGYCEGCGMPFCICDVRTN